MKHLQTCVIFIALAGCSGPISEGLGPTERLGGPVVVYDLLAKPLAEIPLPNDDATRLDPTSSTGRRVNVSVEAPTAHERRTRGIFNRLDGFGTYAPIMVSFSEELDLTALHQRHQNDDFRDDAILLLNVDPQCSRYGEEVALDIGRGRFPITLFDRDQIIPDREAPKGYRIGDGNRLFRFDPYGTTNNILFSESHEDVNGNGQLDPGEDIDNDGHMDVPNFMNTAACDAYSIQACLTGDIEAFDACMVERDRCIADNLLTWYERETNTLIARPLWPLQQGCTYAAVLTKRIMGITGLPVESPFRGVNSRNQTTALKPLASLLAKYGGLSLADVAFTWSFTTANETGDLEALRLGLYGHGPFAALAEQYPPSAFRVWSHGELSDPPTNDATPGVIQGACAGAALSLYWNMGYGEFMPNLCSLEADLSTMSGVFGGTFTAPNLLHDRDGLATDRYPADDDEIWAIDPQTGVLEQEPGTVPFWCGLPIEDPNADCLPGNPDSKPFCKPFPTVIYAHGYGSSRNEIMGFMGRHAAMGVALCALDGPGHGTVHMLQHPESRQEIELVRGFFGQYGGEPLLSMLGIGRDRDLNNDGIADPGGDMWTSDLFHTRDMVRQAVLEHIQFVRVLRGFDGTTTNPQGGLLGDIDGDGVVDLAGPNASLGLWGISLGGVISGVLAGAEPSLDAVSPNAGGAGLADIAARSRQAGVPQAVILPMIGPIVVGCLPTDGHDNPLPADSQTEEDCMRTGVQTASGSTLSLAFVTSDVANWRTVPIGTVEGVRPGDRIILRNLDNGEVSEGYIPERGWFRLGIAADAVGAVERRLLYGQTDDDREPMIFDGERHRAWGDRLELVIHRASDAPIVINTWLTDSQFQGMDYPEGEPLVALQVGHGYTRNNPRFRRFLALAQTGISAADPAVWGAHTFVEPLNFDYDPNRPSGNTRVLMMPTIGDTQVPINTGVAMARVSGLLGSWLADPELPAEQGWRALFTPDERYGVSVDQYLVNRWVVEGDQRLQRFSDNPYNPNALFDVDNVSDGNARFTCGDSDWSARIGESGCPEANRGNGPDCETDAECPRDGAVCHNGTCEVFFSVIADEPARALRLNRPRPDGTHDALRIPLLRPVGQHGIYNSQAFRVFDADSYMVNFTVRYLASRGLNIRHEEGCDCSASQLPSLTLYGAPQSPALLTRRPSNPSCTEADLKVCEDACTAAWGLRTPAENDCKP